MVLGVSPDSVETLRRFQEMNRLPFALGADTDRTVTKLYDVRRRLGMGTSRITYVIDKRGLVRHVGHNEVVMQAHIDSSLRVLDELQLEAPA